MPEYILLPDGQKLDALERNIGGNTVLVQRGLLLPAENPQTLQVSSAALAAGTSADLDSTAIAVGMTGRLVAVIVCASVPCKWVIQTRDGAVLATKGTVFTGPNRLTETFSPPSRDFASIAYGDGNEMFRVTATNLDSHHAADVYATFFWDESS
jgi:hypothetical protein